MLEDAELDELVRLTQAVQRRVEVARFRKWDEDVAPVVQQIDRSGDILHDTAGREGRQQRMHLGRERDDVRLRLVWLVARQQVIRRPGRRRELGKLIAAERANAV